MDANLNLTEDEIETLREAIENDVTRIRYTNKDMFGVEDLEFCILGFRYRLFGETTGNDKFVMTENVEYEDIDDIRKGFEMLKEELINNVGLKIRRKERH